MKAIYIIAVLAIWWLFCVYAAHLMATDIDQDKNQQDQERRS